MKAQSITEKTVTEPGWYKFHWFCDDCGKGGTARIKLPMQVRNLHEALENSHSKVHPHHACPSDYFDVQSIDTTKLEKSAVGELDTKRLDWLDLISPSAEIVKTGEIALYAESVSGLGLTYREAIDAAMSADSEKANSV